MQPDCLVCGELAGDVALPGGLVWEADLAAAFHVPPLPGRGEPYLGHVLVVTRRHVAGLGDLSEEEGAAVGLLPRYGDTPRGTPWHAVDEWEGARRGGAAEIVELVGRLRAAALS